VPIVCDDDPETVGRSRTRRGDSSKKRWRPDCGCESTQGRATGGDFGFRLGKSIALGMVKPEIATPGQKLKIDILGKMYDCTILEESPYDPENNLLRA